MSKETKPLTMDILDDIAEKLGRVGADLGVKVTEIEVRTEMYDALCRCVRNQVKYQVHDTSPKYNLDPYSEGIVFVSGFGTFKVKPKRRKPFDASGNRFFDSEEEFNDA